METAYTILIRDRTDLRTWDLIGKCVEEVKKRGFVPDGSARYVCTIYTDKRHVLYGRGVTPFTSEQYVRGQTLVLVKSKYSGGELKFKVTTDQSKLQGYTKYVDGFCLEWKYCDETDDEKV